MYLHRFRAWLFKGFQNRNSLGWNSCMGITKLGIKIIYFVLYKHYQSFFFLWRVPRILKNILRVPRPKMTRNTALSTRTCISRIRDTQNTGLLFRKWSDINYRFGIKIFGSWLKDFRSWFYKNYLSLTGLEPSDSHIFKYLIARGL